jgi:hypothetical protein
MKIGVITRAWLIAVVVSMLWFLIFAAVFSYKSEQADITQSLVINLQIDAVLLGFSATLIAYVLKKMEPIQKWALGAALAVFFSYFLSILFAFILMPNAKTMTAVHSFLPVSFMLTGILTTSAFFYLGVLVTIEKEATKHAEKGPS